MRAPVVMNEGMTKWGRAEEVATLQVNIGYRCNMACGHCHIREVGDRSAAMDGRTMDAVLRCVEREHIARLDITGGAPELNPLFRSFVEAATRLPCTISVRTNLTVFFDNGMDDLPEFYAQHGVELVASLPCYTRKNVDVARGAGAFDKSIRALSLLNYRGYGKGKGLILHLVYNPSAAFFPASQVHLEREYRVHLSEEHGIHFDRLYALSNIPLGGFKETLMRAGAFDVYMRDAERTFNAAAMQGLMCRHLVSVAPDGTLYDCDFNQVARRPIAPGFPRNIVEFDRSTLSRRPIAFQEYCAVCAAGAGST